ncbi:MAG TPA: caspase family protein [Blastocatellia bacterium]|nr:caspase family protein [Blastocatellia bacterium]
MKTKPFICNRFAAAALLAALAAITLAPVPLKAQTTGRRLTIAPAKEVNSWPNSEKRFALIIGVNQYEDRNIAPLGFAANDAEKLSEALITRASFPRSQVTLLTTNQPRELQPTRNTILSSLRGLLSGMPKDGLLVLSFAGHGIQPDQGEPFLLPSDARMSNDVDLLKLTSINLSEIRDSIKRSGVKQVVLLLDACRNDPAASRSLKPNPMTEAYKRALNLDDRNRGIDAFAVIYATDVGLVAWENAAKRHGIFLGTVVDGLNGEAANERGDITLGSLVRYVERRVPEVAALQGRQQRPAIEISGYKADELIIASGVSKSTAAPVETATVDPKALDLQFWKSIEDSSNPADYEAYLKKFPQGEFAELAKNRLTQYQQAANKPAQPTGTATDTPVTGNNLAESKSRSAKDESDKKEKKSSKKDEEEEEEKVAKKSDKSHDSKYEKRERERRPRFRVGVRLKWPH